MDWMDFCYYLFHFHALLSGIKNILGDYCHLPQLDGLISDHNPWLIRFIIGYIGGLLECIYLPCFSIIHMIIIGYHYFNNKIITTK